MKVRPYLEMLRVHHTVFSLPFAYVGALLRGDVDFKLAVLIGVALFLARSVALLANDLFDRDLDALNPRTSNRPLVRGDASPRVTALLIALMSLGFILTSLAINQLAFTLSFLILAAELSYPFSKRVHCFPHFHLGAVLGFVPVAGAIAVSGDLNNLPLDYALAVLTWVAGFDVLYALQDVEMDRKLGVKSIPACFGVRVSRIIALGMHLISSGLLAWSSLTRGYGLIGQISTWLAIALMLSQHYVATKNPGKAFNMNLAVSLLIGVGIMVDLLYKV